MMFAQVLIVLVLFSGRECGMISNGDLINRVVNALNAVLNFISENVDDMNVDGLFGVALAEAHLLKIRELKRENDSYEFLSNQASEILKQIRWDRKNLSPNYKMCSYQKSFLIFSVYISVFLVKTFLLNVDIWKKNIEFTRGRMHTVEPPFQANTCSQYLNLMSNAYFREGFSDECLSRIINGSRRKEKNCHLDKFCFKYVMESKLMLGYGLTHKVLLLQVAKALGCKWNTTPKITKYCSHVLWEVRQDSNCGFIETLDDLFIEQILLCGSEGFLEFFQPSWIEHVLRLQSQFGCFGTLADETEMVRTKREANYIKFGCTDHATGLAAATLSLFLRILLLTK
ncbi:hypothetical protein RI129_009786 [Pyrocoelia pectoralis]|uniref:Uncharacterized protein n=1 Tax=Pyrocoelia pectoralis TaxID=417401 RepID=A0AAN7VD64_9COLE